jgi:hypothetical protein
MDVLRLARWVGFFCVVLFLAGSVVGLPLAFILCCWALWGWKKGLEVEAKHPDIRPEDWLFSPIQTATRVVEADEERQRQEHLEWRKRVNQPDVSPFD